MSLHKQRHNVHCILCIVISLCIFVNTPLQKTRDNLHHVYFIALFILVHINIVIPMNNSVFSSK